MPRAKIVQRIVRKVKSWVLVPLGHHALAGVERAAVEFGIFPFGKHEHRADGAELAAKLTNTAELIKLIEGLLSQLDAELPDPDVYDISSRDAQFATTLAAAAEQLLELSPPNAAPEAPESRARPTETAPSGWPDRRQDGGASRAPQRQARMSAHRSSRSGPRKARHHPDRWSSMGSCAMDAHNARGRS